jgi:glycosyltransferase involved in cell wall biosynthesis
MKIAITSFTYFPNLDGVAEASRFLAEMLVAAGHDVTVLTSCNAADPSIFIHNNVKVIEFSIWNSSPCSYNGNNIEVQRFQNFFLFEKLDILICQCWESWPSILVAPLLKNISCTKILVSHGFSLHLKPKNAPPPFFGIGQWLRGISWTLLYIPKYIRFFHRFVFLSSRKDYNRFIDHVVISYLVPHAVRIIPNSPNLEQLIDSPNDFRQRYGIGMGPMILCVANFSVRKNQEDAIRAFFDAGVSQSTLVCIGSEENDYFHQIATSLKTQQLLHPDRKVLLLTGMTRIETMEAYSACDITLLTAHQETQPIVLIESMAYSKPWIATSSGCIMQMEGGIAVNSFPELVSWLQKLMTHPELAKSLGMEGHYAFKRCYEQTAVKALWMRLIDDVSCIIE